MVEASQYTNKCLSSTSPYMQPHSFFFKALTRISSCHLPPRTAGQTIPITLAVRPNTANHPTDRKSTAVSSHRVLPLSDIHLLLRLDLQEVVSLRRTSRHRSARKSRKGAAHKALANHTRTLSARYRRIDLSLSCSRASTNQRQPGEDCSGTHVTATPNETVHHTDWVLVLVSVAGSSSRTFVGTDVELC
jgi:hypothetical protein